MKRITSVLVVALLVAVSAQVGAQVITTPSLLYAPLIVEDGVITSTLILYNPGVAVSNATIRYYNPDGSLATSETLAIASKAHVLHSTAPASASFSGALAAAEIEVLDGPNLVGSVSRVSPESATSERMTGSISTVLYDSAFAFVAPSFNSWLSLQNPTKTPVQVTVDLRNPDGTLAVSVPITLAPHASTQLMASTYAAAIPLGAGIEVQVTAGEGLVGTVFRGNATQSESSAMSTQIDTALHVPILSEGLTAKTSLILQNPNDVVSSGAIEFHNLDGTPAASVPFSLPPHAVQRFNVANYLSAAWTSLPFANATVTVSSGPGIAGVGLLYHPNNAFGAPLNGGIQSELIGLAMLNTPIWHSRLSLQNPSTVETVEALLTFYNFDGSLASTLAVSVAPRATRSLQSGDVQQQWTGSGATVEITVISGPGLVGIIAREDNSISLGMVEVLSTPPANAVDSDGDGVVDEIDDCPNMAGRPEWNGGPSAIYVQAKTHKIKSISTFPDVEDQILNGLKVYLFALDEGSIGENDDEEDDNTGRILTKSLKHRSYRYIVDNATPVAVKQIGDNGTVLFGVCPGKYLLIGEEADRTLVGKKVGWVREGTLKKKKLKMLIINNKKRAGKCHRRHGSDMWVIQPAEVEWTATTEHYPFVFETVKTWGVTVDLLPPSGFVSDHAQISADVTDTQRCVQFSVTDIGSAWEPTDVVITMRHEAATEILQDQIDVVNAILP